MPALTVTPPLTYLKKQRFFRGLGLTCLLCWFTSSHSLFAQHRPSISTEFRTDLVWKESDDKDDLNLSRPTLRFFMRRAHFNLNGQVDQQLGYRLRVRWNQSFEPQEDNTGLGMEHWYLRYQSSPALQYRIGKQKVFQGGREGVHNPIDVIGYSSLGDKIKDLYEVGFSTVYDLGDIAEGLQDQTFIFQLMNQPQGSSRNQFVLMYNFAWYGILANGLLEPIAQYAFIPHAEEAERASDGKRVITEGARNESYLTLGMLINLETYSVELDLINRHQNAYKGFENEETITNGAENESSLVVLGKKEGEQYNPFVKWIQETSRIGTDSANNTKGLEIQLGTDYLPSLEHERLRLHSMFSYRLNSQKDNDHNVMKVNLGVSARF